MRGKIRNLKENLLSSLWFIPALFSLIALVLGPLLIEVDRVLLERQSWIIPWLFSGTADAARTILSVIAGSLITVISIAFSLTIIALQQASLQFSPRVLRQFTADRGNQLVIGAYTATFAYALMVLRAIRSSTEERETSFVPALSITMAMVLAIICLGLLIYFIHHVSRSLQVGVIIDRIRCDLIDQFDRLRLAGTSDMGMGGAALTARRADHAAWCVRARKTGFIRSIDTGALREVSFGAVEEVTVHAQVGDFVPSGGILAELRPVTAEGRAELEDAIHGVFVIDIMRSIEQDPMFGIRQLGDIALKALSPGINDPTTAEHVLFHLGDALGHLARCSIPGQDQVLMVGRTHIYFGGPSWADFVDAAFSQIRRAAAPQVHVIATLLEVLQTLAGAIEPALRPSLQHQLDEIRWIIAEQPWSPGDKASMTTRADQLAESLRLIPLERAAGC